MTVTVTMTEHSRHILFINSLEKLTVQKDSSLFLSLALKKAGWETYLLFEEDFLLYQSRERKSKGLRF